MRTVDFRLVSMATHPVFTTADPSLGDEADGLHIIEFPKKEKTRDLEIGAKTERHSAVSEDPFQDMMT